MVLTASVTEQQQKDILVTLGIEAGWHNLKTFERPLKDKDGVYPFIDFTDSEFIGDDWYGDYEYELNLWFDECLTEHGEDYLSENYTPPVIIMHPVEYLDSAKGYQADLCTDLLRMDFTEFLTLAQARITQ
jgi:hypothetical protein